MFIFLEIEIFHDPTWMAFAVVVMMVSALAHGLLGFGFPLISTPVIALVSDMQTAVVLTVLPNLAVNLFSIVRGGRWQESLARYWPMAVWVLLGTLLGTRVLLSVNPYALKLLLALIIAIYLAQERLKRLNWSFIPNHPRVSGMVLGLFAGVLSGSVNVSLPPLVIYFMALGLSPLAMTQILNLCFFSGKITQAAAFALAGHLDSQVLMLSLPLALLSVATLILGMRLRLGIRPEHYRLLVFWSLGLIAIMLAVQGLQGLNGSGS
ncbi:MAG: sulfite exporter TauE/SafE family protein [Betaproteobacteria bacterium]|nr:sulfite exporter TauE/SafE family protein [Betaproteobacteria bacterium]